MFEDIWALCRQFPLITFFSFLVLFALIGQFIVTQYLLYTQVKTLPQVIFTATFMCSLSLLVLVLFEIVEVGTPDLRIHLWYFSLLGITSLCILVVPNLIIIKIIYLNNRRDTASNSWSSRAWLMVALSINFLYLKFVAERSRDILEVKKQFEVDVSLFNDLHVNVMVEFITHYGTWIMAVMSGYGAVWCPYAYLNSIYTDRQKLEAARRARASQIKFVMESIAKTKYELLFMRSKRQQLRRLVESEKTGWSLKNLFFSSKDTHQKELSACQEKIGFLQSELQTMDRAHKDNFNYYKDIIDEQKKHDISQTLLGKFFRWLSFVLSVYSASKIFFAVWNMIMGRKISNDPITKLLDALFWVMSYQSNETYMVYSNYVSFVFMGYLIITSVRSFSINMKNLFDLILRRGVIKKLETDVIVLILSEVYGVYFLSAVVLLQNGLPKIYTANLRKVTGEIRVLDHFTFFDSLFLICSALSVLLLYISEKTRHDKMKTLIDLKAQ